MGSPILEPFAFETRPVSTHHSAKKRGFWQNLRRVVAGVAFAPPEPFHSENALTFKKVLLSCFIVFMGVTFTVTPVQAFLFDSFGIKDEQELGRKFDVLVRSRMPIVEDPEVKGYVRDMLNRLMTAVPPQPFDFTPNVLLHNAMNAFAVPGGYMFVHTGLIMQLEHESELAGVMAHELAHVTQRHVAARIERGKFTTFASLIGMLAGVFIGRNSSSGGGAAITGVMAASQASMLNYSRADENESDQIGLQYLIGAGFRPDGMVSSFEKIRKQQRATGLSIPEYLSTHPDVNNRVNEIAARVKSLPADIRNRPHDDTRFKRVKLLIWARYGDPDQAMRHFSGEDALSIMGRAMVRARKNSIKEATVLFEKALQKGHKDSLVTREAGIFHYNIGSPRAESLLRQALAIDSRDAMASFFLARLMDDSKNHTEAQALLKNLLRFYPDDAEIHYYYGRSLGTSGQHFKAYLHLAYNALYQNEFKKADSWITKARAAAASPDKPELERYQVIYDERKEYSK